MKTQLDVIREALLTIARLGVADGAMIEAFGVSYRTLIHLAASYRYGAQITQSAIDEIEIMGQVEAGVAQPALVDGPSQTITDLIESLSQLDWTSQLSRERAREIFHEIDLNAQRIEANHASRMTTETQPMLDLEGIA